MTRESTVTELRTIGAKVPADLHDQLAALARKQDRSFSAELRRAIREYVERHGKEASA